MDLIRWLQNWYERNCNGEWEHFYGVEIGTRDDPGWYVRIDLKETPYGSLTMAELHRDAADDDWLQCRIEDGVFKGAGDSQKLEEILTFFKNLVEPS